MKLSLRAEYALRALIALASTEGTNVVPIQVISAQQGIPKRFLEQILNDLRSGGFVDSKRGISGGYRLARPAAQITASDILRFLDGSFAPTTEAAKLATIQSEMDAAQFAIHGLMHDACNAVDTVMKDVTIEVLKTRADNARTKGRLAADYVI